MTVVLLPPPFLLDCSFSLRSLIVFYFKHYPLPLRLLQIPFIDSPCSCLLAPCWYSIYPLFFLKSLILLSFSVLRIGWID